MEKLTRKTIKYIRENLPIPPELKAILSDKDMEDFLIKNYEYHIDEDGKTIIYKLVGFIRKKRIRIYPR